jgi:hypothetical protein
MTLPNGWYSSGSSLVESFYALEKIPIMPAYEISEVEIVDELAAKNYMKYAETSIVEYNGQYLARGAKAEVMEGSLPTYLDKTLVSIRKK